MFNKNARSLKSDDRVHELILELKHVRWDVVLVRETWRPNANEMLSTEDGHIFVGRGFSDGSRGVGILVHARWAKRVKKTIPINERLLAVDVDVGLVKARFVSVYFPHAGYSDEQIHEMYTALTQLKQDADKHKRTCCIGGDFNAEVGVQTKTDDPCAIGVYGVPRTNARDSGSKAGSQWRDW